MTYTPNFSDPRTIKRVRLALAFANGFLSDTKPRAWSTRYIDKFFGQQQHPLSQYLRESLLVCHSERYNMHHGMCKTYTKNVSGINMLLASLSHIHTLPSVSLPNQSVLDELTKTAITDKYSAELSSKKFLYDDKSNRLWHELQRVRKSIKMEIFKDNGMKYHYDIECCAPTLIHQHAQQIPLVLRDGVYIQGPMDLYLFALRRYLGDRVAVRNELASAVGITYEVAKEVINALLMGAQLGYNEDTDLYQLLGGNRSVIAALKSNDFVRELRSDIKTTWEYIRPTLPSATITTKRGVIRRKPISNKQKASVYFEAERRVLDSIRKYLVRAGYQHFLEHDGFVCDARVDTDKLREWVYHTTGYKVYLSQTVHH